MPNWSRDGKHLIFYSDRTSKNQIYTMKPDGSDVRRLATTGANDNAASWSTDNKKIAFTSDRDGNSDIYVMDGNGNNVRRLTIRPPLNAPLPGRRMAGESLTLQMAMGPSAVYVLNIDGSNLVRLTGPVK